VSDFLKRQLSKHSVIGWKDIQKAPGRRQAEAAEPREADSQAAEGVIEEGLAQRAERTSIFRKFGARDRAR